MKVLYLYGVKSSSLVISFVFLVIIMANSLKITATIGYYAMFTEDFIERFCENKNKPMLQCDGKCELSKMLLQQANEEETPINLALLKTETVLFFISFFKFKTEPFTTYLTPNTYYWEYYTFDYSYPITHPPRI